MKQQRNRQAKRVLVIGGNTAQIPYIRELKRRGLYIILTDLNEEAPARSLSDMFSCIGYEDVDSLVSFAKEAGLSMQDYIFTAAAQFAQVAASGIAEEIGIIYPKPDVVRMCLDKTQFYSSFERHGIPIPETLYISDYAELSSAINRLGPEDTFYLKSDFSKNPRYVYRFRGSEMSEDHFFWGRDRYLQKSYVLQKEVEGRHLRLNICPKGFTLFDFGSNCFIPEAEAYPILSRYNIIDALSLFLSQHGISSWLIKFDLIISDSGWVALDIGLDPPTRLKSWEDSRNKGFMEEYISLYLDAMERH